MKTRPCRPKSIIPARVFKLRIRKRNETTVSTDRLTSILGFAFQAAYKSLQEDPVQSDMLWKHRLRDRDIAEMEAKGVGMLYTKTRKKAIVAARYVVWWYLNQAVDMSQESVNNIFGRDRTGVSHAIQRIRNRKYDPFLNAVFTEFNERIEGLNF